MKFIFKYLFSLLIILLFICKSHAQLTTTNAAPYSTPQYLVQNVLLGSGITVSNITYNGNPAQIGFFGGGLTNTGASVNIGLDSGIVLTSGDIINCPGPNNNGGATGTGLGLSSDSDLTNSSIIGAGSVPKDAAILEFDFVPIGDTAKFRYVFGSEEYPEYVNSFNDAFAFFLSGPGIAGPYTNGAVNIAKVPGTTTPVTINNVNNGNYSCPGPPSGPCTNCAYYIDNCTPGTNVQYDAFTTVLTAIYPVQCGMTHHIKIAVCDANDQAFDSGVFLEGGSFSANAISISATPPNVLGTTGTGYDTALYEGCGPVLMSLVRTGNLNKQDTVTVNTSGNALNGLDYTTFPDTVIFYPGDTLQTFTFMPIQDGLVEGVDTLIIVVSNQYFGCGTSGTMVLTISDDPPILLTTTDDTINCLTTSLQINVLPTSGIPPLQYQWSTGINDTDSIVTVSPAFTTSYFVTVTDGCLISSKVDTVTVVVINDTLKISTADDTVSCLSKTALLNVQVLSGILPASYSWNTGATTDTTTVSPLTTTNYFVTVTDACGLQNKIGSVTVVVLSDTVQLFAMNASTICPLDSAQIEAIPSGGYPPYQVWWSNGPVDTLQTVNPQATTTYTAYATDQCTIDTATVDVTVFVTTYPPLVAFAGTDDTLNCPGDVIAFYPSATGGSGGYVFSWDNFATTTDSLVVNPQITTTYTVGVTDNCPTDTVYDSVTVAIPMYNPLLVTTKDTLINSCPDERVDLVSLAIGGEGTYTYAWSNLAGNTDSISVFPPSSANYTVLVTDLCGNTDSATVNISIVVPEADFDFEFRADNQVIFTNHSLRADTFLWEFGDGGISNEEMPVYSYATEDEYEVTLTASTKYGCTDSMKKIVLPPLEIWVPNTFTPNGDGINDVFEVQGIGIKKYQIQIYDRWGELLYQSDNILNSWDGKSSQGVLMKTGAFVYHIKAMGIQRDKFEKYGTVTLLR